MRTLLWLMLSLSLPLHARELVRTQNSTRGDRTYTTVRAEEGRYVVSVFEKKLGRLQSLVSEKSYLSKADAMAEFQKLTVGFRDRESHSDGEFVTEVLADKIWTATKKWDLSWETKFAKWVDENATEDFLYAHGIATDCADVAFAYRWIFARINSLPAGNQLAATKELFTNASMKEEWVSLPNAPEWFKDERFLAALNYVLENTYTHSLMADTYPIKINKQFVTAGTIHLNLYDSYTGHTEPFAHVNLDPNTPSPLEIMSSTTPRDLRPLSIYNFEYWGGTLEDNVHAFVRFRWPQLKNGVWSLVERTKMPGFSREQFAPNFANGFKDEGDAVIHRLIPNWNPNVKAKLRTLVTQTLAKLKDRKKIVEDGFNYCSTHAGCEPGTAAYEAWSTPSRDAAIGRMIDSLDRVYQSTLCDWECAQEYEDHAEDVIVRVNEYDFTLSDVISVWQSRTYNSDPRETIAIRWGGY